ncbi:MAG: PIG-L family deacetylase [Clostridia bacterium]|nr:PIG-L family deacetylase [Clostridia bacterium]
MKRTVRTICVLLCLLLLGGTASFAESTEPVRLGRRCTYAATKPSKYLPDRLGDRNVDTKVILASGEWASVSWDENTGADFVYWEWSDKAGILPAPYSVELLNEAGETVKAFDGNPYWNDGIVVEPGVFGVRLTAEEPTELCTLVPYAGGAPSDYHAWEPTPEKVDFLVIATHPDDDALFMGNVIATYGKQLGYTGTILWCTTRERIRRTEALNGAAIMGLTQYPLMAGLPDISRKNRERFEKDFLLEDVENVLIRYIRQVRPEVVITHDVEGEYGHWQHKRVSEAVRLAVEDAANPACDPASAEMSGTWQVKKLYIHLYPENPIFITATEPLSAFGELTGWEIAKAAYNCHQSQELGNHPCNNEGFHSLERFGLAFSTVGLDTGRNDLFENIPLEELVGFEPTPEPTPAPTDIPAPTDTPAPIAQTTDTPRPTDTPQPALTASPLPMDKAASEAPTESGWNPLWLALPLLGLALGAAAAVLLYKRAKTKRRKHRR